MAVLAVGPDWLSHKLSARCQSQERKLREVLQQLWPQWQQLAGTGLAYQLQFEHFPQSLLVYVLAPVAQRELLLAALPEWQLQLQQALFKKAIVLKPPLRLINVCSEFPALDRRSFCIIDECLQQRL